MQSNQIYRASERDVELLIPCDAIDLTQKYWSDYDAVRRHVLHVWSRRWDTDNYHTLVQDDRNQCIVKAIMIQSDCMYYSLRRLEAISKPIALRF